MKCSEVIGRLSRLLSEHGDLEVGIENQEFYTFEAVYKIALIEDPAIDGWFTTNDASLGKFFIGIG